MKQIAAVLWGREARACRKNQSARSGQESRSTCGELSDDDRSWYRRRRGGGRPRFRRRWRRLRRRRESRGEGFRWCGRGVLARRGLRGFGGVAFARRACKRCTWFRSISASICRVGMPRSSVARNRSVPPRFVLLVSTAAGNRTRRAESLIAQIPIQSLLGHDATRVNSSPNNPAPALRFGCAERFDG